jgi:hypothetical protein
LVVVFLTNHFLGITNVFLFQKIIFLNEIFTNITFIKITKFYWLFNFQMSESLNSNPYAPYKSPYHVVFGEEMVDETQRILNETLYQQLNVYKDEISNIEVKNKKINKRLKERLDTLLTKSLEKELFYQ